MLALLGDLGGTNVRFALGELGRDGWRISAPVREAAAGHGGALEAAKAYLSAHGAQPEAACLAVAGPVTEAGVRQTNATWSISREGLEAGLGLKRAAVIMNDFTAVALGASSLSAAELASLGSSGLPAQGAMSVFLGPGTGLGVAGLLHDGAAPKVIASEGGHASFAPTTALEAAVLQRASARRPRVSYESLLSGPGIELIHACLCDLEATQSPPLNAAQIVARAATGEDRLAAQTINFFCGALGAFAGDIALMFGADAGVFLAGGVAHKLRGALQTGTFRTRFEAKAPHAAMIAAIPTLLILDDLVALRGAALALENAPIVKAARSRP